jgi:hypothetical protein
LFSSDFCAHIRLRKEQASRQARRQADDQHFSKLPLLLFLLAVQHQDCAVNHSAVQIWLGMHIILEGMITF